MLWKGKSHVAKGKSGRGRRRSREKGYQGVEDFRFITFIIFSFFSQLLYLIIFFYTLFTHYIYPHPHPRPTTFSYTRLYGNITPFRIFLVFQTTIKSHCWSFKPRIWQPSHMLFKSDIVRVVSRDFGLKYVAWLQAVKELFTVSVPLVSNAFITASNISDDDDKSTMCHLPYTVSGI